MIYKLKVLLKNNEKIRYFVKCIKKYKDNDFKNRVLYGNKYQFTINSFGDKNFGKTIYNIDIVGGESGFFALIRSVLQGLYCAKMGGFIPFIYLHDTYYSLQREDNIFEYFFLQPSNLSKKIVDESAFVAEYDSEHRRWVEELVSANDSLPGGYLYDESQIDELSKIWREFIKLNYDTELKLSKDIERIINKSKTVAVHYRGNAYKVGFYGHPVALQVEDYFDFLDNCINNGYNKVFVATDDENALKRFISRYGEKIVYYDDVERSSDGIDIHNKKEHFGRTKLDIAYEVLRDMYTISNCDAFICGKSQVSIAAIIKKKADNMKFEMLKIIDKGLYEKEKQENVYKYWKNVNK